LRRPSTSWYDGGGFEMAMGMEIHADGTFGWGISVGALDLRAIGTWRQEGDFILFTSDPKPVAPEFNWIGHESVPDGPLVRVTWSTNGEEFQYASARLTCSNGSEIYGQILAEGWSPPEGECDTPKTIQLFQEIHKVESQVYDLEETFKVGPDETIRFEFQPNDMGVADFSGVSGTLKGNVMTLQGARWPMELRKLPPRD